MKIFEIYDNDIDRDVGTLLYYEKERTFIAELRDDLDEWTAPLLFSGLVKKGIYTVPRNVTRDWIGERVIPNSRQNIGDILRNSHLREYDEMKLLELSEGRCSQDNIFFRRLSEMPEYVATRQATNLKDVCLLGEGRLLCFFADDVVKEVDLEKLADESDNDDIGKILKNQALFESGKVGTGGYFVTFNDSIDIPATDLSRCGGTVPLKASDFITFVKRNIMDTNESCKTLGCTRQNLSYIVSQKDLAAVKEDVRGNLYLKGDVIRNTWD